MADPRCSRCGASAPGLVCSYCGALSGPIGGEDLERKALEEFCGLLAGRDWKEQARLIESGYIPTGQSSLIDAGVRCIPFVQGERFNRPAEAAARRLEAITVKLKVLPQNEEVKRAVAEFEGIVRAFRKSEASDAFWGLTIIAVLLVAIIATVLVITR